MKYADLEFTLLDNGEDDCNGAQMFLRTHAQPQQHEQLSAQAEDQGQEPACHSMSDTFLLELEVFLLP